METVVKIAAVLFVTMVITAIVVQVVTKIRTNHKKFSDRKKALHRMTDAWFRVCYQNCQQSNWKNVSRKERKAYEIELKRRGIKL